MGQEFIGVYATNERAPSLGDFPRPVARRKRLWFVWQTLEGRYKVQPLNAVLQPMAEARFVSAREFEGRFFFEKDCDAAPEGYIRPGTPGETATTNANASLPDLFMTGTPRQGQAQQGVASPLSSGPESGPESGENEPLRADDPDLLRAWVKGAPRTRSKAADAVKIPFDRLVGEVAPDTEDGRSGPDEETAQGQSQSPTGAEADQIRVLRSQFVQALLLLRSGEKEQSLERLRAMLTETYPFFEGGAQLFSEIGLGLRRLGMISLALAAHKKAQSFAPRDERILFNIARSYHDLDHLTEAREYLKEALAVNPDFAQARQFLAFLEISEPEGAGWKTE